MGSGTRRGKSKVKKSDIYLQVAQYLNYIGQTFATSALETAFAAGGGLITTK